MFNSAKFDHEGARTRYRKARARVLRQFCRNEEGGILIMALMLIIIMLVMGGMAVDFMRFESRRALLQSVSDRAVLAAAELDQTLDPADVVEDYFQKAGFGGSIIGSPIIDDRSGSRSVEVRSELELNTFYLRLIGIDTLDAPAASAAIEGTGNIEVSLVLDISGSMDSTVRNTGRRRYQLLQTAASNFVDELLKPEYENQVSISLVNYSANVNIGDDLFDALNIRGPNYLDIGGWDVDPDTGEPNVEVEEIYQNPSRCIDFNDSEFSTTTFDTSRVYQQVEHFDFYSSYRNSPHLTSCPQYDYEAIIPLTQDANRLKDAIRELRPRTYTAIHMGVKWGVTLLDPSMRDLLATIPSIDPEFRGQRPFDYATAGSAISTVKYLVLMTDGENVANRRLYEEYYDTTREVKEFRDHNFFRWVYDVSPDRNRNRNYNFNTLVNHYTRQEYSANQADNWMQSMCTAAKDRNITVFTIAMGAPDHGAAEMKDCASTPGHFFEDEGGALDDIFANIAKQITDLRLSL